MSNYDFHFLMVHSTHEDLTPSPHIPKISGQYLEPRTTMDADAPIDFIPDIDTTMKIEWQSKLEPHDMMDDSGSFGIKKSTKVLSSAGTITLSLEIYEPVRLCTLAAPPKRFYRTFWRSIARRLLERKA